MCTGRIDPATVAGAFRKGLDGLMVVGCYFGDCHYITGNHQGQAKMNMTQKLLRYVGLNQDRVAFAQCSSGEASRFVELVSEFGDKIKALGPLGSGSDAVEGEALTKKLTVAERVLATEKMRWVIGKRSVFMETGNMYGEVYTDHEFSFAIDMVIVEETDVQEILLNLGEGPLSVKDLAGRMNMPASRVFRYVTALKRKEMVALDNIDGQTPYYRLIPQEVQASGQ